MFVGCLGGHDPSDPRDAKTVMPAGTRSRDGSFVSAYPLDGSLVDYYSDLVDDASSDGSLVGSRVAGESVDDSAVELSAGGADALDDCLDDAGSLGAPCLNGDCLVDSCALDGATDLMDAGKRCVPHTTQGQTATAWFAAPAFRLPGRMGP